MKLLRKWFKLFNANLIPVAQVSNVTLLIWIHFGMLWMLVLASEETTYLASQWLRFVPAVINENDVGCSTLI